MHPASPISESQEQPAASHRRQATWLDTAPVALLMLDAAYRCTYANAAAATLLGRAREELLDTSFLEQFAAEERPALSALCALAYQGMAGTWASTFRQPGGRSTTIEYLLQPDESGGSPGIVVQMYDVTATRRQARWMTALATLPDIVARGETLEEALDGLVRRVAEAGELAGCLVWLMQEHTGGPHVAGTWGLPEGYAEALAGLTNAGIVLPGRRAFLTRQTQVLPGLRSQLLAEPAYAALHPFWREFAGESVVCVPLLYGERALGSLVAWHADVRGPREDELAFLQAATAQVALAVEELRLCAMLQSSAREDPASLRLRETEAQYRAVFEATSDGLIITDMTGVLVEANSAVCRMHGYSYDEFINLPPGAIMHADSRDVFVAYRRAIAEGHDFHGHALDVRKDGSTFPVEVHGVTFTYLGKPATLGIIRDITEQTQAYQLLERGVEERTRELTALLEVSHDMASTLELQPLLGLILNQLRTLVDYKDANIMTLEGNWLTIIGYYGAQQLSELVGRRIALDQAVANRAVIQGRQPIIIDDVMEETPLARSFRQVSQDTLESSHLRLRSWLGVPLISKEKVIGMLGLCHPQPAFYTQHHATLALAIANQAAVAIENARLYGQAQEVAAFKERQRLARELHDSVSQALYGIALGTRTARALASSEPAKVVEPLDYVLSLAEAGMAEMRALIFELRPESLATDGLTAAIGHQTAMLQARHQLDVQSDLCMEPDLPYTTKEALYRVVQEALHNVVKHARAQMVRVRLERDPWRITLTITDDGVGFDPNQPMRGHLGLQSMQERINGLGGRMKIRSAPGQGTTLEAWIPS